MKESYFQTIGTCHVQGGHGAEQLSLGLTRAIENADPPAIVEVLSTVLPHCDLIVRRLPPPGPLTHQVEADLASGTEDESFDCHTIKQLPRAGPCRVPHEVGA